VSTRCVSAAVYAAASAADVMEVTSTAAQLAAHCRVQTEPDKVTRSVENFCALPLGSGLLYWAAMDPITISIISAVAGTGAEMLMNFLKPHAVKMIERLRESRKQRRLQSSGTKKRSSNSTQRESEQSAATAQSLLTNTQRESKQSAATAQSLFNSSQRESELSAATAQSLFEQELERYKQEAARRLSAVEGARTVISFTSQ
jgi:hypothetical protein